MQSSGSKRALSAASIGNFGEIYDFAVFGFSVPFIAAHFFPTGDSAAALLSTFAVYAVAFVARPVGGLLFGYLLDRIGRVKVLSITIWLMAAGTAIIGLLPTYASIGLGAPLLLVICRFAQGLAMGGELTGSTSFILEAAPPERRGRWVGFSYCLANIPNALVALMLLGFQLAIGKETYLDWAWRVPFLIGGLIGIVGYWLRRNLEDPDEYKEASRGNRAKSPFGALTRSGLRSMMYVAMIMPIQSVAAYLLLGFMYTFLVKQVGMDSTAALLSNAVGIAAYAFFYLVGGTLSDRFGRKPVLMAGAFWLVVVAYFAVRLAANGSLIGAVTGQVLLGIGIGLYGAACSVAAAELFPTSFRATGHAIAYQVTVAVMGGTTPLVSAVLIKFLHSPLAPGWYVTIVAAITLILVQFVPETKDVDLRTSIDGQTTDLHSRELSSKAAGRPPG
jgi:MHS family proline/betaine transporter-like MFS transporter